MKMETLDKKKIKLKKKQKHSFLHTFFLKGKIK